MPRELKSSLKVPSCVSNIAEITTPREIKFSAPVPQWIKGTLWTSGPGIFDMEKGSFKSWGDGLAIVTKYEIHSEHVFIQSRYVNSIYYKKAMKANRPVMVGILTPPGHDESKGFFSKFGPFTLTDLPDNPIGIIHQLDHKFYIIGDSQTAYEISPKTLSTVGSINIHKLFGLNTMSPNILRDPKSGERFIAGTQMKPTFYNLILRSPTGNLNKPLSSQFEIVGAIPSRWRFGPCMTRKCFAVSENYIIFIETPLIPSILRIAATYIKHYRMFDWLEWLPNEKTRFYLVSKSNGAVLKTEYLSFQAFVLTDVINAYEDGDNITLDICTQPNPTSLEASSTTNIRSLVAIKNYVPGSMERYVIPIISELKKYPDHSSLLENDVKATAMKKGDKVILTPEVINFNSKGYDFGVINPNYVGNKYKFVYTTGFISSTLSSTCGNSRCITKVHLTEGNRRQVWDSGMGTHVWKPEFVPNPNGIEEDDGALVALVTHLQKRQSDYLIVLNAKTMEEMARAELKECNVSSYFAPSFFPGES